MSNLPTWRTGQAIRTRSLPIIGTKHGARVSASCRAGRLVYTTSGLATSTLDDDHHEAASKLARRLGWIDTPTAPKGARLYSGTLANGDGVHLIASDAKPATPSPREREAHGVIAALVSADDPTATDDPAEAVAQALAAARSFLAGGEGLCPICLDYHPGQQRGVCAFNDAARDAATLRDELRDGIERVKMLVSRWEGGDLAEAVNTLEGWADFAESAYFPEGVANPYDAEEGETE